jgi:putative ABC transport system permease protein
VDPNLPITHITTMDGLVSDSVSPRRFSAVLVGIFAALAFLLTAIGIYGVMSYTVSQRTREIGLRMALGAQLTNVRGMILGQTLKLTLIGVGLGLTGAFVLARFLESLLFGIGIYDPVTDRCCARRLLHSRAPRYASRSYGCATSEWRN